MSGDNILGTHDDGSTGAPGPVVDGAATGLPLESRAGTGTARTGTVFTGTAFADTAEPLLRVSGLTVALPRAGGDITLVDGVDLEVRPGEVLGVAGESGSGKTVTGMTLVGLGPDRASVTGSVRFDGRELVGLPDREWARVRGRDIAVVFQDPSSALHPMLTVGRQITDHVRRHQGISRKQAAARAVELLDLVRIPGGASAAARYPHQFSGGMRQRIAIASALACGPRLLIADEPTTALDVTVQAGIVELLDELRRETGMAVVMVTHDLGVLSSVADRIAVFYSGRVIETGTVGEVIGAPQHPYTRGLLQALPHASLGERSAVGHAVPLRPIPGSAPAAGALGPGCPFRPRCSSAVDGCDRERPVPVRVGPARTVACLLAEPGTARPADAPPGPGTVHRADVPSNPGTVLPAGAPVRRKA
ncbi:ABC transporter ATP-binding protein [Streptomyces sp. NBC_00059]|uniref:ABC transporter ATP-binding protein n=1 Tax=Streptomyces sp. NBC_00059 TaxID=2975635 RepID=UPI00224CCCDC|nr:ABC transporter ATP-binding protein [Streptomyces sp. NBC_00059]MCX5416696.1 ABC transporter ATP-binding protein [Streptomyces sp. NBC_00059]